MGDLRVDVAALQGVARTMRRAAAVLDGDTGPRAGGDIGSADVEDAFERARRAQAQMVAWLGVTAATLATGAADTAALMVAADGALATDVSAGAAGTTGVRAGSAAEAAW